MNAQQQVVRKLIRLGSCKGITIPKCWLDQAEKESGRKVTHLKLTIDHALTVEPIFTPVNLPSVLRARYSLALASASVQAQERVTS
jgi:hypothetical protein